MKKILIIILILLPMALFGQEQDGKYFFRDGIIAYNSGRYEDALKSLGLSAQKLPIIGDYALLYSAKSYIALSNASAAIDVLDEMLVKYPSAFALKTAQLTLIKTLIPIDKNRAVKEMQKYITVHPEDCEIKLLLSDAIKEESPDIAKAIYRDVYVRACPGSAKALSALDPSGISAKDYFLRANTLIKSNQFKEAEGNLRTALERDSGELKSEIRAGLANAVFKQKKYREAAEIFLDAGDLYGAAQSYSRAKEYAKYDALLTKLINSGDRRTGGLMISRAMQRMREGKIDQALSLLAEVKAKYQHESEAVLWHIGWINYMEGRYQKAFDAFSELSAVFKNNKYSYWKARSAEMLGNDATVLFSQIEDKRDFYSTMKRLRNGSMLKASYDRTKSRRRILMNGFERPDILADAGLKKEAVAELLYMSKGILSKDTAYTISIKLMALGEYTKAIGIIVGNFSEAERPDEILYPLAFQSEVLDSAKSFGVDPILILSLIREESRYNPEAFSTSGAIGLMQLMPETASRLSKQLKFSVSGTKPLYEPAVNIKLGTYYLGNLLDEFGSASPSLASYNAGEHRVREWLKARRYNSYDEFIEDIAFVETREYVKRILTTYGQYKSGPYASLWSKEVIEKSDSDGEKRRKKAQNTPSGTDPFHILSAYVIINR